MILLPLALLCLLSAGCRPAAEGPAWPVFDAASATNAHAYVAGLVEFSPRDAGSEGAAYASQWIAQSLRAAGLKPRADVWRERSGSRPDVQFCNVYADIPGETNALIVIGSHYDTKGGIGPRFQGANDGGSSTGVLLEAARLFAASGVRPRHTLRFAFFDGEECFGASYAPDDGLHGSRRMARRLAEDPDGREVVAAVVLDMVGDDHLCLQCPRNVTPWLASLVLETSVALHKRLGGDTSALVRIGDGYIIDDHWPFIEHNIPAIDLIDFDYGSKPGSRDYWHTELDTLDKIRPASLGVSGQLLLDFLERIDSREASSSARE